MISLTNSKLNFELVCLLLQGINQLYSYDQETYMTLNTTSTLPNNDDDDEDNYDIFDQELKNNEHNDIQNDIENSKDFRPSILKEIRTGNKVCVKTDDSLMRL